MSLTSITPDWLVVSSWAHQFGLPRSEELNAEGASLVRRNLQERRNSLGRGEGRTNTGVTRLQAKPMIGNGLSQLKQRRLPIRHSTDLAEKKAGIWSVRLSEAANCGKYLVAKTNRRSVVLRRILRLQRPPARMQGGGHVSSYGESAGHNSLRVEERFRRREAVERGRFPPPDSVFWPWQCIYSRANSLIPQRAEVGC